MRRVALIAGALLAAPAAHAGNFARLEFERALGAERCPDRDAFDAIVASRLGTSPWSATSGRLVRILFAPDGNRVTGRMELLDGGAVLGVRDVSSSTGDCHEVAETLGLTVALALDPPGVRRVSGASDAALPEERSTTDVETRRANAVAFGEVASSAPDTAPPSGIAAENPVLVAPPAPARVPGVPIPLMLFAASEGGYSHWSGGTQGDDEHIQSSVWSGDFSAGGEAPLARGYLLDVLVTGYSARRFDGRAYMDLERHGRGQKDGVLHVRQSVGATAMRAAVRVDREDAGVSLGLLIGGFERRGCHHARSKGWQSALCGDFQQWAAFPTFGARMGPQSGPYATIGFLDSRFPAGEIAHLGVGAILPGDRRVDTSIVAAAEGVGARLQLQLPVSRQLVLLPALSGGILYDTFLAGGSNVWVRAGCGIALRR